MSKSGRTSGGSAWRASSPLYSAPGGKAGVSQTIPGIDSRNPFRESFVSKPAAVGQ
jgi:hypothetical protein